MLLPSELSGHIISPDLMCRAQSDIMCRAGSDQMCRVESDFKNKKDDLRLKMERQTLLWKKREMAIKDF